MVLLHSHADEAASTAKSNSSCTVAISRTLWIFKLVVSQLLFYSSRKVVTILVWRTFPNLMANKIHSSRKRESFRHDLPSEWWGRRGSRSILLLLVRHECGGAGLVGFFPFLTQGVTASLVKALCLPNSCFDLKVAHLCRFRSLFSSL